MAGKAAPTDLNHLHRSVAQRHNHDHRLYFPLRDEIVENDVGAAHRGPCACVVAKTVQQIQHGIRFFRRGIVARRSIDVVVALIVGHGRLIKVMMHFAARHILHFPRQRRIGDVHEIFRRNQIRHQPVIVGIERAHSVDDKRISVIVWRERGGGHAPYSLVILLHGHRLSAFALQLHVVRVGSAIAKRHAIVGMHFGRNQPHRPFLRRLRGLGRLRDCGKRKQCEADDN